MLTVRPDTETIAVTRTFDGIEAAAHRIIEHIGGMDSVMRGAKVAILKPNFVAGRNAETGSTTSFALLKAVAEEVRACGARASAVRNTGHRVRPRCHLHHFGRRDNSVPNTVFALCVSIPKVASTIGLNVRPRGAKRLRHFRIPRILSEARLINLPVLKTHVVSTMTLGMKNPMGILPRPDRRCDAHLRHRPEHRGYESWHQT